MGSQCTPYILREDSVGSFCGELEHQKRLRASPGSWVFTQLKGNYSAAPSKGNMYWHGYSNHLQGVQKTPEILSHKLVRAAYSSNVGSPQSFQIPFGLEVGSTYTLAWTWNTTDPANGGFLVTNNAQLYGDDLLRKVGLHSMLLCRDYAYGHVTFPHNDYQFKNYEHIYQESGLYRWVRYQSICAFNTSTIADNHIADQDKSLHRIIQKPTAFVTHAFHPPSPGE
ncbi:hypothetical protein Plec18167_006162 [Paecilomyces lecythidis]|uniref:Uncharacterized protein n=1 Tax=Paecilomyces lecythidis TaxID=3004212 RepID=A0ABR3XD99_9EURO